MLSIQIATYNHIDQILGLNNKYQINHLTAAQKLGGFIRIIFTKQDLQQIIAKQEIVVALINQVVVGYYLIGASCQSEELANQRNKAISLFNTHQIQFNKIGYSCQVCIHETFRNNGLFKQILNALLALVKNKYSILLCAISDDNPVSITSHKNTQLFSQLRK